MFYMLIPKNLSPTISFIFLNYSLQVMANKNEGFVVVQININKAGSYRF